MSRTDRIITNRVPNYVYDCDNTSWLFTSDIELNHQAQILCGMFWYNSKYWAYELNVLITSGCHLNPGFYSDDFYKNRIYFGFDGTVCKYQFGLKND